MSNTREANNNFYSSKYNSIIYALILEIIIVLILVGVILYQLSHRPLPQFFAISSKGQQMELTSSLEPNLQSGTLIRWASKAAVAAYTFDFGNYKEQLEYARHYFTDAGWASFQSSISGLISTVVQNQLFVNGVVAGPPVIANQGELSSHGYTWRIQIPFLVTYQAAGQEVVRTRYTVTLTIVRVPTFISPAGIGIDQFVMS